MQQYAENLSRLAIDSKSSIRSLRYNRREHSGKPHCRFFMWAIFNCGLVINWKLNPALQKVFHNLCQQRRKKRNLFLRGAFGFSFIIMKGVSDHVWVIVCLFRVYICIMLALASIFHSSLCLCPTTSRNGPEGLLNPRWN